MRSKIKSRKRRGGMDHEAPPPYSPPRSPPVYRRTPPPAAPPPAAAAAAPAPPQGYGAQFATSGEERNPSQLTQEEWSALQREARDITFEIRQPSKIVFNSRLPENNMATIKLGFPMVALPSLAPLIPKIGDKVVAVNKSNSSIKYLLGTVVKITRPRDFLTGTYTQGFALKIRTPESEDLAVLQPFFLNLNSSNYDIIVINEQSGGTKKRKTSKGKTKKRKGGKRKNKKNKTNRK